MLHHVSYTVLHTLVYKNIYSKYISEVIYDINIQRGGRDRQYGGKSCIISPEPSSGRFDKQTPDQGGSFSPASDQLERRLCVYEFCIFGLT